MAGESFLSPADIAEIWQIMDDGMATVEAFSRPDPIVQFRRMNETTGQPGDLGLPVRLISITFGLREGTVSTTPQLQQDAVDGDILMWADTIPMPQPGDWFIWQGERINIQRVYPEDQGTVAAEISLSQVSK